MSSIIPVILCGGSGTRLWPSSRKAFPKQFSPLLGDESLFSRTVRRFADSRYDAPLIMTAEPFRFLVREQAEAAGMADARIVLEPEARDTAPAILVAALMNEDTPEAHLLVAPSDHMIADPAAFHAAVDHAVAAADAGQLVTFGISPNRPETAFGYLELGEAPKGDGAVALAGFTEKPALERAEQMVASGNYLWNAGIFLFTVKDILTAYETHAPAMIEPCRAALEGATEDLGFVRLEANAYGRCERQSIDYAIMEKARDISVVPVDPGWSDLGSWASLHAALTDAAGAVLTDGRVTAIDCENSVLRSEDAGMHLVGLGLRDTVAVAMRDAVLVADMSQSQRVKDVVETLRRAKVRQADEYPRYHRPWGWYETLCIDSRFQVKRIMVRPGGVLSLQSHVHRSEHWVVVAGTAKVTVGDEVRLVSENESVYIPLGTRHRLENPGKVAMYLIEVQTGAYLGEDDITRYEDVYSRT